MAGYVKPRNHLIGIVGESFDNEDGSSRQAELAKCRPGEPITLLREPLNRFDKGATLVVSVRGVGIGYLSKSDRWIGKHLDDGVPVRGIVNHVHGGQPGKPTRGCVIHVRVGGRDTETPIDIVPPDDEPVYAPPSNRMPTAQAIATSRQDKPRPAAGRNWLGWLVAIFLALLVFVGSKAGGK